MDAGSFNSLNIVVMVNNCQNILKTNLLSFDAVLKNKHAVLHWKTSNETDQTKYEIHKSLDGISFHSIGILKAFNQINSTYTFIDPDELHSYAYYRVVVQEPTARKNSRVKLLNVTDVPFEIITMVNPFKEKLTFELSLPANSIATIVLSDQQGKTIKMVKQQLLKGVNQVDIDNLGKLPGGTYILKVMTGSGSKTKKLIKIVS
jgi:hypothetical protein